MENIFNKRTLVLLSFIVLVVGLRTLAPLNTDFGIFANFSGLGAMAIFSGSYFRNKWNALLIPMVVLFISDVFLAATVSSSYLMYEGWYFTYIALAAMVASGHLLAKKVNFKNVLTASLVGVVLHWLIADFGVWLGSGIYPQTLAGYMACLVAAIPFELRFLYGTLIYSAVIFTAFEALKTKFTVLQTRTV
jgi:hypothetical protein